MRHCWDMSYFGYGRRKLHEVHEILSHSALEVTSISHTSIYHRRTSLKLTTLIRFILEKVISSEQSY